MMSAVKLSEQWKTIINNEKVKLGLPNSGSALSSDQIENRGDDILGEEYTSVTSTLGSLEAKELSNNPLFAAMIVRLIAESGIDTSKTIGVQASGSFPALTIQSLAALQVLNRKAVLISSLGASSYGANQPGALWIDMEGWLNKIGKCKYHSELITYGAEGDTAGGLTDEGKIAFDNALQRNGKTVFIPRNVEQSIEKKLKIFEISKIGLLINIGGNQSALGYCSHAEQLPNGLHKEIVTCSHKERGVISRVSENSIPFIHLLNLKNLAARYEITDRNVTFEHPLFFESEVVKWRVLMAISLILTLLTMHYRAIHRK